MEKVSKQIERQVVIDALENKEDFINLSRYGCSLTRLLERYPDGVPDGLAAEALMVTVPEYLQIVETAINKLKTKF